MSMQVPERKPIAAISAARLMAAEAQPPQRKPRRIKVGDLGKNFGICRNVWLFRQ
jgi:hypothetical protein